MAFLYESRGVLCRQRREMFLRERFRFQHYMATPPLVRNVDRRPRRIEALQLIGHREDSTVASQERLVLLVHEGPVTFNCPAASSPLHHRGQPRERAVSEPVQIGGHEDLGRMPV